MKTRSSNPITTTCPHCWSSFEPGDVLAIASHSELRGDLRLGSDEMMRFLPSHFRADGMPIDPKGQPSPSLACPNCHLPLPEASLDYDPLFVSILGAPACGKSFFLAAMCWEARTILQRYFHLTFTDADPSINVVLADYERSVFLTPEADKPVVLANLIRKTQLEGQGLYSSVSYGDYSVRYPKPFMFVVRPNAGHANSATQKGHLLCLYDNAGEQFLPGSDSSAAPVTQHLAKSKFLLFLFDPTMDLRFRRLCGEEPAAGARSERQESVLAEAIARIRRLNGMRMSDRDPRPLIVVLTKSDLWGPKIMKNWHIEPWAQQGQTVLLDHGEVMKRSKLLGGLLQKVSPELVSVAEGFSSSVTYVAASIVGNRPPRPGDQPGAVRPAELRPAGVITPLLLGLFHANRDLVPVTAGQKTGSSASIQIPNVG